MTSKFVFTKEQILQSSDPRSPFYVNLPPPDAKPIDNLVNFFKYWKYFIKSLIYYFKEIALVKEFEANLSYQLINSIQFPGFKDLPVKVMEEIGAHSHSSPTTSQSTTPTKEHQRTLSNATVNNLTQTSTNSSSSSHGTVDAKRPGLFKTKSNNSTFLKNINPLTNTHLNHLAHTYTHTSTHSSGHSNNQNQTPNHKKNPSVSNGVLPVPNANHNDVKIPPNFFPDSSLFRNLPPVLLTQHHSSYNTNNKLYKDLNNKLIPRLETLLKNLSSKIREIKASLKNESFSSFELLKEISKTGKCLSSYMSSIERYSASVPVLKRKHLSEEDRGEDDDDSGVLDDPFLVKLQVDYQVKHQLIHENFMFASYVNLQNISKQLFNYVVKELDIVVDKFGKLQLNQELYLSIKEKLGASANADWEYFISMNRNLLNIYRDTVVQPRRETRTFSKLVLPYADSIHNKCIRFGMIYKKSKLLKNYNRCYFVLSCNYLHEFKIEGGKDGSSEKETKHSGNTPPKKKNSKDKIGGFIGHDDIPAKSYNLNNCILKMKDEKGLKFQLIKKTNQAQKHTFKCLTIEEFESLIGDLEELTRFGSRHLERFNLVQSKIDAMEKEKAGSKSKNASAGSNASSAPSSSATSPSSNKLFEKFTLNLSDNNSNGQSLSGIFTPTIKTPLNQSPNENPFEETFMTDFPVSDQLSPRDTAHTSPASPDPNQVNAAGGASPKEEHQHQHELYLKMQQELINQRKNMMSFKGKENDKEKPADPTGLMIIDSGANVGTGEHSNGSGSTLSRPTSTDSVSSFMITPIQNPQGGIQSVLQESSQILTPGQGVIFELNDNGSTTQLDINSREKLSTHSDQSSIENNQNNSHNIPKVVVSDN